VPLIARPTGFWTAVLTPLDSDYGCDVVRLGAHCRHLLDQGCDGIALFGTTGEGPEFSTRQRLKTLDALIAGGIPVHRILVSASSTALADSVELSRHATQVGAAGVLVMPPFFLRNGVTDEGVFTFYAALIDHIGSSDLKALLYHIPSVSGVAVRPPVIRRLVERYGDMIIGIKDSGGDWTYTQDLLQRFTRLSVFTGTESHIHLALDQNGAGTICGLGNVITPLLRQLFDCANLAERRQMLPFVQKADSIMSRGAFVACLKSWIASEKGDPGWALTLPPMMPLTATESRNLVADFRRFLSTVPAAGTDPCRRFLQPTS
jgi:4-hydroxy-tetrahydrodipicolinate synthase